MVYSVVFYAINDNAYDNLNSSLFLRKVPSSSYYGKWKDILVPRWPYCHFNCLICSRTPNTIRGNLFFQKEFFGEGYCYCIFWFSAAIKAWRIKDLISRSFFTSTITWCSIFFVKCGSSKYTTKIVTYFRTLCAYGGFFHVYTLWHGYQ